MLTKTGWSTRELADRAAAGEDVGVWAVVFQGILELHNPAQIDVIKRMYALYPPPGSGGLVSA
ncbi:hypothetical protein JIG36_28155 [Actinoplanes sp. LDG1-06]|uniref:Uncharacterized protein n=1 Tax=Paractinoplanes ovalisporus TaxID=2810368 RepID=A0ABS2AJ98_9ACTN|nr:hypothetical protein [Actinoplanes ovalisporus]MBM2619433.1 hypothetical protein [Actinoplanes ovalisporus]